MVLFFFKTEIYFIGDKHFQTKSAGIQEKQYGNSIE
jgi:hypothetical protein